MSLRSVVNQLPLLQALGTRPCHLYGQPMLTAKLSSLRAHRNCATIATSHAARSTCLHYTTSKVGALGSTLKQLAASTEQIVLGVAEHWNPGLLDTSPRIVSKILWDTQRNSYLVMHTACARIGVDSGSGYNRQGEKQQLKTLADFSS